MIEFTYDELVRLEKLTRPDSDLLADTFMDLADLCTENGVKRIELEPRVPGLKAKLEEEAKARALETCKRNLRAVGAPESWAGKTFRQRRSTFRIVECRPNRPKYPILTVNQNGKRYKWPVYLVRSLLGDDA